MVIGYSKEILQYPIQIRKLQLHFTFKMLKRLKCNEKKHSKKKGRKGIND